MLQEIGEALARNRLLGSLEPEERAELAGHMEVRRFGAGAVVISQGATDRDLYLVVEGRARIVRDGLELGPLVPGDHFGEMALVDGAPRSATVLADTPLVCALFGLERYGHLAADHPALALRLTQAISGGLAVLVRSMTEDMSALLRTRSAPGRTRVTMQVDGERVEVAAGTALGALLPERVNGDVVVAALVDRRPLPLGWPVSGGGRLDPLTTAHWEGERIYRSSLGLLLLEAAHELDPDLNVQLEHSLGLGQNVLVSGIPHDQLPGLAADLEAAMFRLVDEDRPLQHTVWSVDEAAAWFAERDPDGAATLLRTWRQPEVWLVSYGAIQVLRMGPLVPRAGRLSRFGVVADGEETLLLVHGRREPDAGHTPPPALVESEVRTANFHARKLTDGHGLWRHVLRISAVGQLNQASITGRVGEVIRVVEADHEKRILRIAEAISERPNVRVVCVAGPSASGKTTFIRRLKVQLQVLGMCPHPLSLDDYYVDREQTPRDASGDYDYEAFEALRLELLEDHLGALLRGEPVRTARYDFETGESLTEGGPVLHIGGERDILLIEGIHGLNTRLPIPDEAVFRVFVCPLAQLPFDRHARVHASDVRLIRRIVRDRHHRGSGAGANIARWPKVRRGEREHIFPNQHHADAVFDSSLVYELSVLRVYAQRYLHEVPQTDPSYTTAYRLLGLLEHFVPIYPDHVPQTSLLREFIGGSGFRY